MTPDLATLQRGFLAWLASGDENDAAVLPLTHAHGLAVYQNNYRGALMACLADSYPQTLRWLGEAAFEASAARHIDRVPPHSWTLDDYALGFPASLASEWPDDREVAELAAIELALDQIFVAGDAEPLTAMAMDTIDWDTVQLRTVPALTLLGLHSNAADIWIALSDEASPPPVELVEETAFVLIWRQEWQCRLRPLEADEAEALAWLIEQPVSFTDLCGFAVARRGEAEGLACIGQWLAQWIAEGLVQVH